MRLFGNLAHICILVVFVALNFYKSIAFAPAVRICFSDQTILCSVHRSRWKVLSAASFDNAPQLSVRQIDDDTIKNSTSTTEVHTFPSISIDFFQDAMNRFVAYDFTGVVEVAISNINQLHSVTTDFVNRITNITTIFLPEEKLSNAEVRSLNSDITSQKNDSNETITTSKAISIATKAAPPSHTLSVSQYPNPVNSSIKPIPTTTPIRTSFPSNVTFERSRTISNRTLSNKMTPRFSSSLSTTPEIPKLRRRNKPRPTSNSLPIRTTDARGPRGPTEAIRSTLVWVAISAGQVIRRRLFNLWSHNPRKWANAITDDVISSGVSIYIPSSRWLQRSTNTQHVLVEEQRDGRNILQRFGRLVQRPFLWFRRNVKNDDPEYLGQSYEESDLRMLSKYRSEVQVTAETSNKSITLPLPPFQIKQDSFTKANESIGIPFAVITAARAVLEFFANVGYNSVQVALESHVDFSNDKTESDDERSSTSKESTGFQPVHFFRELFHEDGDLSKVVESGKSTLGRFNASFIRDKVSKDVESFSQFVNNFGKQTSEQDEMWQVETSVSPDMSSEFMITDKGSGDTDIGIESDEVDDGLVQLVPLLFPIASIFYRKTPIEVRDFKEPLPVSALKVALRMLPVVRWLPSLQNFEGYAVSASSSWSFSRTSEQQRARLGADTDTDTDPRLLAYAPVLPEEGQLRKLLNESLGPQILITPTQQVEAMRNVPKINLEGLTSGADSQSQPMSITVQQQQLQQQQILDVLPPGGPKTSSMSLDDSFAVRLGRSQELREMPASFSRERIPTPTKADFSLIRSRSVVVAIEAALHIVSESDGEEFLKDIGMKPLFEALVSPSQDFVTRRIDIIKGICRVVRKARKVAGVVAQRADVMNVLCDTIEAPLRGMKRFQSNADREKELRLQREAVALVQRLVRCSDAAVEILAKDGRLKKVLFQVSLQRESDEEKTPPIVLDPFKDKRKIDKKKKGETFIVDFHKLKTSEMARVAAWGLGGVQWTPKMPGQKGLRILSFDGGGTRGVLSVAVLKELLFRVGNPNVHEMFDVICGTSTGGIIAVLFGVKLRTVHEAEMLYDLLIDKIFGKGSNLKLVSEQAFYDENEWENILYSLCGDELLIDSNQREEVPRTFCISSCFDVSPPQAQIWRNYNYPVGQDVRYKGTFRVNTQLAVRATTAAPTFFTPVMYEGNLYCDGALVSNNPTAIAVQEAKAIFPGVPVELVVSIGTGVHNSNTNMQGLGWDKLINQIIATSVDTEEVHNLLQGFLPPEQYYRFNPVLKDNIAIDQKNKSILMDLKRCGKELFFDLEKKDGKRLDQLVKLLRGSTR